MARQCGRVLFLALALAFSISRTDAQLVAERITKANASSRLFGGTDVNGGIGDWYLSNGTVEAIIDDAGFNSDLAAVGARVPNQYLISPTGGTLIDLGVVGKDNDQLNQVFQVANLSAANSFFFTSVRASVTAERAAIIAEGFVIFGTISTPTSPTLLAQTTYSLSPREPFLTLTTTVTNAASTPAPLFNISDAVPLVRGLIPFAPFPGRGFNQPNLVLTSQGIAAALGVYPFVAFPGSLGPENGMADTVTGKTAGEVSYGIVPVSVSIDPDGAGPQKPAVTPAAALLGVNSVTVTAVGNVFDPTKSPLLPAGGTFAYTRRILLGTRNDVASVTNAVFTALGALIPAGTLTGDIDAEDQGDVEASLIFEGKLAPFFADAVAPLTQVRTDKRGRFAVVLPQGDYSVTITSPERTDLRVRVTVGPGERVAAIPKLSAVGKVKFTVTEGGRTIPAKLTFIATDGGANPDFSRFVTAAVFDPVTNRTLADVGVSSLGGGPAMNFVFTDGSGEQTIRPGKYEVIASHGLEYTIGRQTVDVAAGRESSVSFALQRVVDTTGFVSADFHVHSARSFDASAPLEDRVRSYVADGVEVIVSTDHNFIIDFAPVVEKLRMKSFAKTIIGNELTTSLPSPQLPQAFGHHNVFPVIVDPTAPRRGAPFTEYVNAATFYDRARAQNPGVHEVIQLDHPRAGVFGLTLIGLFNTIGFDPRKTVSATLLDKSLLGTSTRNIDFDAIELYNGNSLGQYQQVRNDWFSLLDQNIVKTATAVSDSHRIVVEAAGFPRTYVVAPTDDPASLTDEMVTSAVFAHQAIGTSGPFVRFDIDGRSLGSLVPKNKVRSIFSKPFWNANITVLAPAWVPVDEVRLYANGRLLRKFDATPAPTDTTAAGGVERFRASIKLTPDRDTYYVVEAGTKLPNAIDSDGDGVIDRGDTNGDGVIDTKDRGLAQPPSPGVYASIVPGFVPLAFTNPIWVDRNGNGIFDPPGIDPTRVQTLRLAPTDAVFKEAVIPDGEDLMVWYRMQVGPEEMRQFYDKLGHHE
jgi:hypothetical protein